MKSWLMVLASAFIFTGCSSTNENPLVISTDVWIGASPLYYAHAMGWLKEANIEMLQTGSIEENLNLYDINASDIITGTEHEYLRLKKKHTDLIPIIIYDRSYGGDVVLSNRTTEQLINSNEKINVYVELDTVGEDMLNFFLAEHNLSKDKLDIYNRNQEEIVRAENLPSSAPLILVSYNPHDLVLKEHGFKEVASSKSDNYMLVDSFFTSHVVATQHKEQLKTLKILIDRAIRAYHNNPENFYATVKAYLGNPGFKEFEQMRANIQWINNEQITPLMKQKLDEIHYPVADLIK